MAATFALSAPFYVLGSAFLLFALAVVVRAAFGLIGEAKSLTRKVAKAGERMQDAAVELRVEAEEAQERAARLGRSRRDDRHRRRTPSV